MADIMEDEIYPLVIIRDRYTGVYTVSEALADLYIQLKQRGELFG